MNFRWRSFLLLIIAAVVPLMLVGAWSLNTIRRVNTVANADIESSLIRTQLQQLQGDVRLQWITAVAATIVLSVLVAAVLSNWISRPVKQIVAAAKRVASGERGPLDLPHGRGTVAREVVATYNTVLARLDEMGGIAKLQREQLGQRGAALEASQRQNERHSKQLETSAQIVSVLTSTLDLDRLLDQVVNLISENLGHYHTGVYLIDETGRWAVLKSASSDGGKRLVDQGYRLEIGAQGMVGIVTSTGQSRVAGRVGADAFHLPNPELPETRSEATLPLIAHGKIRGALDLQSQHEEKFDTADLAVLDTLANQIALALDYVALYQTTEAALAQAQAVQMSYVSRAWEKSQLGPVSIVLEDRFSTQDIDEAEAWAPLQEAVTEGRLTVCEGDDGTPAGLAIPIKVRGQVIGALGLQEKERARSWNRDEIALAETVADQVGQAMEAARLLDEAQRQTRREQRVSAISARIRSAPDIDSILQIAVKEIRQALGASHGVIRLGTETHLRPISSAPQSEGGKNGGRRVQG